MITHSAAVTMRIIIRASECLTAFVPRHSHPKTHSSPAACRSRLCVKATVVTSAPGSNSASAVAVIGVIEGVAVAIAATAGINKTAVRDTQDGVYPAAAQYPAAWPVATSASAANGIILCFKKVERYLASRTRLRVRPVMP